MQLLHSKIPKAQKDSQLKQLFALLGSLDVKAACKHVVEITPEGGPFPLHSTLEEIRFKFVFINALMGTS